MILQNIQYRHVTLAVQLLAGIALLTASYLTTEQGWATEFLDAAIYKSQPTEMNPLQEMKAGINC